MRTVFEMVNDHVPQGDSPRTASVNEAIDRGADYGTMALLRAGGRVRGGDQRHGRPAARTRRTSPFVAAAGAPRRTRYFRWGVQVDDLGLQQVLQLWEDAERRARR